MISRLYNEQKLIDVQTIKIKNKFIQDFVFCHPLNQADIIENKIIIEKIMESNCILINQYLPNNQLKHTSEYMIIGFKKTIIIIKKSLFSILQPIFQTKRKKNIYFLSKIKDITFNDNFCINTNLDQKFCTEINNFNLNISLYKSNNQELKEMWDFIRPCISGSMIKEGYEKINVNKLNNFINDLKSTPSDLIMQNSSSCKDVIINENDFIELRNLGNGSIFAVFLIYHIEREELYALKKQNTYSDDIDTLKTREFDNYTKIQHPFIPKFIGSGKNKEYIIIEFIDGMTLTNIHNLHLNYDEKIIIIFKLMIIIEFLHRNHFIFRDLKPDNIMIDNYKNAILIDFDRMIEYKENITTYTNDFSFYSAPEVNNCNFSYECDIYSLSFIIYYIMEAKIPTKQNLNEYIKYKESDDIKNIIIMCYNEMPNKRKSILEIIVKFYALFYDHIKINDLFELYFQKYIDYYDLDKPLKISLKNAEIKSKIQYIFAQIYEKGRLISQNINKSIHFYLLAADQNNADAQYKLGLIYTKGELIPRDIDKAIHYYLLAAKQNHSNALFNLGYIYSCNEYCSIDISKAIYYYSIASNQNNVNAQYNLGMLYYDGLFISRNIDKAIYYFTLAANQNNANAQNNLGFLYYDGKFIQRNIDKAIYYFTLAANQKNAMSQFILGEIYNDSSLTPIDIDKAIYYYTLAANQNYIKAQVSLGIIYYESKFVQHDYKKAFYYFSLAEKQFCPIAQYFLGIFYFNGEYVSRDIDKSIYYMSLSAKQNYPNALYFLGRIYLEGNDVPINVEKSIDFFTRAAKLKHQESKFFLSILNLLGFGKKMNPLEVINLLLESADGNYYLNCFIVGYLYHSGGYAEYDIKKAIYYYKEASSFNNPYAKNNLGIIYANGFKYGIEKNIGFAIQYFKEAIQITNNCIPLYNLAHIYFYEKPIKKSIKESIKLLIKSSKQNFYPSKLLLCIASIIKFGTNIENIINHLSKYEFIPKELSKSIYNIMILEKLEYIEVFEEKYNILQDIDFVFDDKLVAYQSKDINNFIKTKKNVIKLKTEEDINSDFYEGFG